MVSITVVPPYVQGWQMLMQLIVSYTMILALSGLASFSIRRQPALVRIPVNLFLLVLTVFVAPTKLSTSVGLPDGPAYMFQHFSMACLAACAFHRWLEVFLGTAPHGILSSRLGYVLFMAAMVEVKVGPLGKLMALPPGRLWDGVMTTLACGAGGLAVACLLALDLPWMTGTIRQYVLANFFASLLTGLPQLCANLLGLLFGVDCEEPMRAPTLLSQGVNDFWGRRWNRTVHRFLHRIYYQPVMNRTGNRWLAYLAAFLGSGMLHEALMVYIILHSGQQSNGSFTLLVERAVGSHTLFFLAQAALCLLERLLQRACPWAREQLASLPRPAQTLLTALAICPLGGLFTKPLEEMGLVRSIIWHFGHLSISS